MKAFIMLSDSVTYSTETQYSLSFQGIASGGGGWDNGMIWEKED